jgi:hypothetical protein
VKRATLFAEIALQELMHADPTQKSTAEELAKDAYEIADAMMTRRNNG